MDIRDGEFAVVCKLNVRGDCTPPVAYEHNAAPFEKYGEPGATVAAPVAPVADSGAMPPLEPISDAPDAPAELATTKHRIAPICSDPPIRTSVSCHWCMAPFESPPVGMPTRRLPDGRFSVSGVFCSLECACAHNFDTHHASHAAYTRHALCCEMASEASRADEPVQIRPAPPRAMLRTFGGPLTIEQFRDSARAYTIVYPLPVVSQVHHAEELAFPKSIDGSRSARFVPIDDDTIDAFTRGLKRPSVGTRGFKSTLEYLAVAKSALTAGAS